MKCCDEPTVVTVAHSSSEPADLCAEHSKQYDRFIASSFSHVEAIEKVCK